MHYFQFNIGDYARATRHLSNDEDLAYRRLLDMYYENERPIPLETQWVARRIQMDTEVVEVVLNDMFKRTEDGWRNGRCDSDIAEYHARAERNRLNGKRGGRPKSADKNPVGFQSEPSRNPNQEPITINQEPYITPYNPPSQKTLKPDGLDQSVWDDWRRIRKKPVTPTSLKRIETEAAKIGWTLAQAITEASESGWQGFKADWVKEQNNGRTRQKPKDGVSAALDDLLGIAEPSREADRRSTNQLAGHSARAIEGPRSV